MTEHQETIYVFDEDLGATDGSPDWADAPKSVWIWKRVAVVEGIDEIKCHTGGCKAMIGSVEYEAHELVKAYDTGELPDSVTMTWHKVGEITA